MEKTIANKMPLYEILTMLVPGALIVFCIWLLDPSFWSANLSDLEDLMPLDYLYHTAIILLFFAIVYVVGLLNYWFIDGVWRLFGLRNSTCIIKNQLNKMVSSGKYNNVQTLMKDKNHDLNLFDMSSDTIQDIYYEAYTYALKQNKKSNIPYLEHQVAMLKGLIVPALWLMSALPPFNQYKWISMFGASIVLFTLAIWRQKHIVRLVMEDYEYEKRLDTTTTDKTKDD